MYNFAGDCIRVLEDIKYSFSITTNPAGHLVVNERTYTHYPSRSVLYWFSSDGVCVDKLVSTNPTTLENISIQSNLSFFALRSGSLEWFMYDSDNLCPELNGPELVERTALENLPSYIPNIENQISAYPLHEAVSRTFKENLIENVKAKMRKEN